MTTTNAVSNTTMNVVKDATLVTDSKESERRISLSLGPLYISDSNNKELEMQMPSFADLYGDNNKDESPASTSMSTSLKRKQFAADFTSLALANFHHRQQQQQQQQQEYGQPSNKRRRYGRRCSVTKFSLNAAAGKQRTLSVFQAAEHAMRLMAQEEF